MPFCHFFFVFIFQIFIYSMVHRYHIYLDRRRRFRVPDKRNGPVFAQNRGMEMEAEEVLQSVRKAKERRNLEDILILHSDRGIQLVCGKYQELTAGMKISYSWKGNPWDNACIESFHALIKRECLKHHRIQNYEEAHQLVFEYIEKTQVIQDRRCWMRLNSYTDLD